MRTRAGIGAGGLLVALLLAAAPVHAETAQGVIDVKLPYHVAYELAPIQMDVGVRWAKPQVAAPFKVAYRVYDFYKNEVAKGDVEVKADSGEGRRAVTFTPPRYGWYTVILTGGREGEPMTAVQRNIGVTPKFAGMHALAAGELHWGWNDEALQAFAGLALDRTGADPKTAPAVLEQAKKYGVTLLVQINDTDPAHIKDAAAQLKGKAKYWEIVDEPNAKGMEPEKYVAILKQAYETIKAEDPEAVVMGPDTSGIHLDWHERFYKAGGGKFIDALSIHDNEGDESIDPFHWNWKLGELRKIMAAGGDAAKPIWQTSRAISGVRQRAFLGATQAVRLTLERDILETFGVANDHNNHYYANVTGYFTLPSFVVASCGPYPAALAARTRCAMTLGRKFVEKIDFGPTGNKIFLGLRYHGDDGDTVMLRNLGCLDLPLEVVVKRESAGDVSDKREQLHLDILKVVDSFGNEKTRGVVNGKATLTISQMPIYIRLAKGQTLTVPPIDFGKNIAAEARFTYSGATESDPKILTDGLFQNFHLGSPWGKPWSGAYAGKTFNEKPETLEIAFAEPRAIAGMLVFGVHADNPHSAILDYDLQYHDGKDWVTIEEVRTPCPPSDAARGYMVDYNDGMHPGVWTSAATWFQDNNFFVHQFKKPVTTDRLRLVIRRITRGFLPDMAAEDAINAGQGGRWKASGETLELREIEIYGPAAGPAGGSPAAPGNDKNARL